MKSHDRGGGVGNSIAIFAFSSDFAAAAAATTTTTTTTTTTANAFFAANFSIYTNCG